MRLWRTDESSNIRAVGYDDGKIQVEFSSGARYEYCEVDEVDFLGILTSKSVGRRVHEVLVSAKKPFRRLTQPRADVADLDAPLTDDELSMLARLDGPPPVEEVKLSRSVATLAIRAVAEIRRGRE